MRNKFNTMNAPNAGIDGPNSYRKSLEAAWACHLARRGYKVPTVISLFAGCGGSSLGYSIAGYRELMAVEWGDYQAGVFERNFPKVKMWRGDIKKLRGAEALRFAGIKKGELSVLDGSPPCQGFSTSGRRNLDDPRNSLFREFVRLLKAFRPHVFIMENVGGMVKGKMRLVFREILSELKSCGYVVEARLMNAAYFGVPQDRRRIIIVGTRDGEPTLPRAASVPVTIGQACPWITSIEWDPHGKFSKALRMPGSPSMTITTVGTHYSANRDDRNTESDLEDAAIKETYATAKFAKKLGPGRRAAKYGTKYFNLVRGHPDKPCPTITAMDGGSLLAAGLMHPTEMRRFTIPEIKRFSSFPDEFEMGPDYGKNWAAIGNSVPPLFMRAIAEHVRKELLGR